jgi:hypothetical protein
MTHNTDLGARSDNTNIESGQDRCVRFESQYKLGRPQQYPSPARTVIAPGMIDDVVGTQA